MIKILTYKEIPMSYENWNPYKEKNLLTIKELLEIDSLSCCSFISKVELLMEFMKVVISSDPEKYIDYIKMIAIRNECEVEIESDDE